MPITAGHRQSWRPLRAIQVLLGATKPECIIKTRGQRRCLVSDKTNDGPGEVRDRCSGCRRTMSRSSSQAGNREQHALPSAPTPRNEAVAVQQLTGMIWHLDHALCELLGARGPVDFARDVVLPALREIGHLWAGGDVAISSEHLISASVRSLAGLSLLQRPAQSEDLCVLFSTPSGEPHELGVMAAAVAARNRDIRVIYLGPQLPPGEILQAAEAVDANLLCLGWVLLDDQAPFNQIAHITAVLPRERALWLGGSAPPPPEISAHPQLDMFADLEAFENALRIKTLPTSPRGNADRLEKPVKFQGTS